MTHLPPRPQKWEVSGAPQHFQPHVRSFLPPGTGQRKESRAGERKRREEGTRSHPALPASMDCCEDGSGTLFMMKTITSDCWYVGSVLAKDPEGTRTR